MLKKKVNVILKQSYNRGHVREVRRWSAKPFTRVQIPLPSPTIGVKMKKGIDVYIDSGVHLKGFSELTEEAKELAKKRFIDEIKNDTLVLVWDTYEEGDY